MIPRRLILTQTTWDGNAAEFPVELSGEHPLFVIGSAEDADLCLEDQAIAERHWSLTLTVEGVELASLLSYPLAVCNGVPVYMPIQLHDGDAIGLGDVTLMVRVEEAGDQEGGEGDAAAPEDESATKMMMTPSAEMPVPATGTGTTRGSRGLTPGSGGSRGATSDASGGSQAGGVKPAGSRGFVGGSRGRAPSRPPRDSDSEGEDAISRLIFRLEAEFPKQAATRTRREFQILVERGCDRARTLYGLEQEDHIEKFLQCIMLLDDELVRPTTPDVGYVIDTLTVTNKLADRRIARALSIARKAAGIGQAAGGATGKGSESEPQAGPIASPRAVGPSAATAAASASSPPMSEATPFAKTLAKTANPAQPVAPDAAAVNPIFRGTPMTPLSAQETAAGEEPFHVATPARGGGGAAGRAPAPTPRRAAASADDQANSTQNSPPPAVEDLRVKAANVSTGQTAGLPEIEGYRILDQIASGGMGTVYRAFDLQLEIEVAIKVLRSMHPVAQQQFLVEARAAAKLQHPNIVPVLRYERYGQGGYFVMQLIRGKDAHNLTKAFGEMIAHHAYAHQIFTAADIDPATVTPELRTLSKDAKPYYQIIAHWIAGVADGLDRAHADGIIHYDVKPSNLMLSADGRLMLGDFGLATLGGQASASSASIGTPAYLSPEMLAGWAGRGGAAETDLRVDIWGLGLSLYEFLTYGPAFEGNLGRVLRAIATLDPAPPRQVVWEVPEELERICMRAIARNPENRYS
ncbi:MAG: serine/threonine-protein kinase, partial [Variovorax sp.]|nr:serine/threonine-protein kinase [Variovorax sp.]